MKYETVIEITNGYEIDFEAPGAAMRLAWLWTAQEMWSAREFDTDNSGLFARHLRTAWVHVKMVRNNRRRANALRNDPRIKALNEQKAMLQNRPFETTIREEEHRINAEIAKIMDAA